jgi:hypothetical protein
MPREKKTDSAPLMGCTVATAATILCTTRDGILSLVAAGHLRAYGKGVLLRIILNSVHEYKAANPDLIGDHGRGYVYLIWWNGYYKIGKANNVAQRIREITSGHPIQPTVIHIIPTDAMERLEKQLHKRFAAKRINGEWFDLSEDDVKYIKNNRSYILNRLPAEND